MPIGEQVTIASHTGNGVATVFAYSFGVLAADDLKVLVNGVEVTTGFTVAGIGSRTGGTVTFSVAPASGAAILIVREVVRKRDTDYQYSGDLREEVLDDDFDRIWMALQEDGEIVQRGVRAPVGEALGELSAAALRANKVLTFGPGGAIALVDIAAFSGGGVVELVPADGSIALGKLTTAVQALVNGALQRSGGTMTGKILLDGDATLALHPVPKQQLDAAVASITRPDLSSAGASVASNELTVTMQAEVLSFRSADLTSGAAVVRTASASSLTVPSGATLGVAGGRVARIAFGLIDNAGTPEPFVVNVANGVNLDETTLINTTAISVSADSAGVFYSTTSRTGVAFRVRGYCDITPNSPGSWSASPTKVQGIGGLSASALGVVRKWQSVTRNSGTTYYNTTGYEIVFRVAIQGDPGFSTSALISIDGGANITICQTNSSTGVNGLAAGEISIPPGSSYSPSYSNTTSVTCHELR